MRDPLAGQPCKASNTPGAFGDGGVLGRIPADRLYAPGMAILNFFPAPNALGKGFNYRSQIPDSYPRRESLIRLDYNPSPKWKVFGHYLNNKDSVTSAYGSLPPRPALPTLPSPSLQP